MAKLSDVIKSMEEYSSLLGAHLFLLNYCGSKDTDPDVTHSLKMEKLYLDGYILALKQVTEL